MIEDSRNKPADWKPLVKIDFFIAGFAKCGSTTLWSLLKDHPQIFMPGREGMMKESNFFSRNQRNLTWPDYARLHRKAPKGALLGDPSVSYSSPGEKGRQAVERIHQYYPQAKFIFIARDPFKRMESHYRHLHHGSRVHHGWHCPFTIEETIEQLPNTLGSCRYWHRMAPFIEYFGDDQILVVLLEDLIVDPDKVIRQCFGFLGVDTTVSMQQIDRRLNSGSVKLQDTPTFRALRQQPIVKSILSKISLNVQNQFLDTLGWREPIDPLGLQWSDDLLYKVVDKLHPSIEQFLHYIQRNIDVWPRYQAVVNAMKAAEKGI